MPKNNQGGDDELTKVSSVILSQNVVDYLRDEAMLASVSSGKALEKWLQNPANLLFLVIIIVVVVRLFLVVVHGLLMLLLKKLL